MKRIWFFLSFFCLLLISPTISQANTTTIEVTQNATARFTLSTGEDIKYAELTKGQRFLATQSNEFWQLHIGNAKVSIPRHSAKVATKAVTQHKRTHKIELITTSSVPVYASPSMKNKSVAIIAKNMRISSSGRIGNYYEILIGARKGYIHHSYVEHDNGVPILIYHHLVVNHTKSVFKNSLSVLDIRLFREQMDYLTKQQYKTISLKDFDLWMQKKQALPGKAVAITFDDANLSVPHLAYPILKERNMSATTFVITDRVKEDTPTFDMEKIQFSGFDELRLMQDIIELEYHTHGLHTFNSLTARSSLQYASNNALHYDFQHANDVFKQIDPTVKPRYFAYPYGKFERVQESVYIKNGVSLAFLNKGGKAELTSPRLYVPRIPVQGGVSLTQFKKLVGN